MSLFQTIGESAANLAIAFRNYCFINPFDREQQRRLGSRLIEQSLPGNIDPVPGPAVTDRRELDRTLPWIRGIIRYVMSLVDSRQVTATAEEYELVSTLSRGELYFRYRSDLEELVGERPAKRRSVQAIYQQFESDYESSVAACETLEHLSGIDPGQESPMSSPSHAFAVFFQIRRAFGTISSFVKGRSRPTDALRAAMWESVFSTDFQLYGDQLFDRMHDINTLVLGPSGTGKDLVAKAIGGCRYLPYNTTHGFDALPEQAFRPVNLSEFSRDLIESELFGHAAGSFTGATTDREGVFDRCEHYHTLFLDEIGELEQFIQVKLLRVLQERSFYRVGDRARRYFGGKIVSATNRDLEQEMNAGRFRKDLYFRLCADIVRTPKLRDQLDDAPEDLPALIDSICKRVLGTSNPTIIERLAERVTHQIDENPSLGAEYAWPGNFRELEQCVRSTLIHGDYRPASIPSRSPAAATPDATTSIPDQLNPVDALAADIRTLGLTWDELLDRYVQLVHRRSNNISDTARRLGKHRTTVQKRLADSKTPKERRGSAND